jgi:RimJ/RimL family protein N-acetyltransferase
MRNPIVVGARVYLRALELSDAEALALFDAEETETFMYRGRAPISPLFYEHWATEEYKRQPPGQIEFAVCLRGDDRLIGAMGVGDLDWVNRTGETGSYLGRAYRGAGYGTEGKHLLLEYCFDRLQLHVLCSTVFETNTRSAAALVKQGYRPAGRLRRHDVKGGVYRDMLMFDLKREEWLTAREAWLTAQPAMRAAR